MIARFWIRLPFTALISPDAAPTPVVVEKDAFTATIYPPHQSELGDAGARLEGGEALTDLPAYLVPRAVAIVTGLHRLDDRDAIVCDAIQIDISAPDFDRSPESDDPPTELAFELVNGFLARLRAVARTGQIRTIAPTFSMWQMRYVDDDGGELPHEEGMQRGRGASHLHFAFVGVSQAIWADLFALPDDYMPRAWEQLILDAFTSLDEVGPALVLAAAAVETRVATALDVLAEASGADTDLWTWLNDRNDDYRKQPSVAEQLDHLLKWLAGVSLKSEPRLWEMGVNLRAARNTFVHEGKARIGLVEVDRTRAGELVSGANSIVDWIDGLLPAVHQRPAAHTATRVISTIQLNPPEPPAVQPRLQER